MAKFIRLVFKNDNFSLSECSDGFYLYDYTLQMNIAMYAKSEQEAYQKALHYYQKRLKEVTKDYKALDEKVQAFVGQFKEEE